MYETISMHIRTHFQGITIVVRGMNEKSVLSYPCNPTAEILHYAHTGILKKSIFPRFWAYLKILPINRQSIRKIAVRTSETCQLTLKPNTLSSERTHSTRCPSGSVSVSFARRVAYQGSSSKDTSICSVQRRTPGVKSNERRTGLDEDLR